MGETLPLAEVHTPGRICCFQIKDDKSDENIILFTPRSLNRCHKILQIRKECKLKYGTIALPDTADEFHGYHLTCYRIFTALPKLHRPKLEDANECETANSVTTRSAFPLQLKPSASTGVFPNVCIFCNQRDKKVRGKRQKLVNAKTKKFEACVRRYIRLKEDRHLETKLQGVSFAVKEVKYHPCCRVKYQTEAEKNKVNDRDRRASAGRWRNSREAHSKAFEALAMYLQDAIIARNEVLLLSDVTSYFHHLLQEFGGEEFADSKFNNSSKVRDKIEDRFKGTIFVRRRESVRNSILHSSSLTSQQAFRKVDKDGSGLQNRVRDIALRLREEVQKAEKYTLPEDLKLADIEKGEVRIPDILQMFFQFLVVGPDMRRWGDAIKDKRAKSICQDTIFSVTSGRQKPAKHLMLGIAMKSMTGSKKVVQVLNRFGHCASYNTIEELETELTIESSKNTKETPYGMHLDPSLGTGVAWDNFDRYVDTSTGKDTLHDTVGIAYQLAACNMNESPSQVITDNALPLSPMQREAEGESCENNSESFGRKRRRRAYDGQGVNLMPYAKKSRVRNMEILAKDSKRRKKYETSNNYAKQAWNKDVLWMSGFVTKVRIPMWSGWNTSIHLPQNEVHGIWYLPQINHSPTSKAVVAKTMERSLDLAIEAKRSSIAITYDLAVAKIAMQIQIDESPKYDQIFVALGSFHIEMAFFKAIGKLIAESGGPDILAESEVIAQGSLNSFYKGSNFKRCKRMHELLSLSMEILHFERFLDECDNSKEIKTTIEEELHRLSMEKDYDFVYSKEISDMLNTYAEFCQQTSNGVHGKTARFWMLYVNLMHTYHAFVRAIRTGDLDLYVSCFPIFTAFFFALNHVNYARWMVKYYNDLLKLCDTHPEVHEDFKSGWFGIKRTTKPFSRIPIDLTLEQTINADSASQRHGTLSLSNSISARQRWAESHFLRSAITSKIFQEVGMTKEENTSRNLRASCIENNITKVKKVKSMIKEVINPFDSKTQKEQLFNIVTGKSVSFGTETFLLSFMEVGWTKREQFIDECVQNPGRFEKRIPQTKVSTFATDVGVKKITALGGKYQEACLVRDIFGSLLYHALEKSIDIEEVLKYPLTPIPLSLCHSDGSMQKSSKAALLNYLESRVVSVPPSSVDITIIDASFFLHTHQSPPTSTFGGLAKYLLSRIMESEGKIIHFVTDKWLSPSIKDPERESRLSVTSTYSIQGPSQRCPTHWSECLKNVSFKIAVTEFLSSFWADGTFASIIQDKILYMNSGDSCFRYSSSGSGVQKEEVRKYYSTHEEADNRIFFHAYLADSPSNIVIRTSDTDCLVIALGCHHHFQEAKRIWLDVGVESNNTRRYISINELYFTLGRPLCEALPLYHALTGSDYTSSFCRRGKVKPLKVLEKSEMVQRTFGAVANAAEVSSSTAAVIEKFVCHFYGKKDLDKVNDVRTHMFLAKYQPKSGSDKLSYKKLDASLMPPCSKVLGWKVKRAHLVARRWASSMVAHPPMERPQEAGWVLEDGRYKIFWFDGNALPSSLDIECQEASEDEDIFAGDEESEVFGESSDSEADDDETTEI